MTLLFYVGNIALYGSMLWVAAVPLAHCLRCRREGARVAEKLEEWYGR